MQLLKMDKPQCILYAAAMVLYVEPKTLIHEIGHDGMRMLWPELQSPACFQSFHIQEIIDCFIRRGFGLTPIEQHPANAPNHDVMPNYPFQLESCKRFKDIINGQTGIMIGKSYGRPHAWAWDGEQCYDPNSYIKTLNDYAIEECWIKTVLI